ncbi:polysaccharide deacetylase family protein [Rhodococcus sp. PAE-6]|uniref:polysaccharide deacetylase family protein n=1 Tax=Rhodococcus sp. PAE-6 TaxID=2972477 RepID=UPI0021B1AE0F|nr:polysaccharide deacetylase family protein [Rhodococcus sp. PAE-6]MCT7290791.1 polysaccharide deacetylase family protein [Rhodococcus sp. PAE-6]
MFLVIIGMAVQFGISRLIGGSAETDDNQDIVQPVVHDPYVPQDRLFTASEPPVEPLGGAPGMPVVSMTFDDGFADQIRAARTMSQYGMEGTFYVNSGTIGTPGHLTSDDLIEIANGGHEIGGHTVNHSIIEALPIEEAQREICIDRKTLLEWGFPVRSFAYPFGAATPPLEEAVEACGYNSARDLGDLRSVTGCFDCPVTEHPVPPQMMLVRAPAQVEISWTIEDLQQRVLEAMDVGTGLLPLTFHRLCTDDCNQISIREPLFAQFVAWLSELERAGRIAVRPMGDALGGPVQPARPVPARSPAPAESNALTNPNLQGTAPELPECWSPASWGANSPTFATVPGETPGTVGLELTMDDHVDGDAKFMPVPDLGTCAPSVVPGHRYVLKVRYRSTAPTQLVVQYRLARGVWTFGAASPEFASTEHPTWAEWTTPPIPVGVTGISFGLSLARNGTLVTSGYEMYDRTPEPSSPVSDPHEGSTR